MAILRFEKNFVRTIFSWKNGKKIYEGIVNAYEYLGSVGVTYFDLKPENVVIVQNSDGTFEVKIIDFGLIVDVSNKEGFRRMGYVRRGSRFQNAEALRAGTPGFCDGKQIHGFENCLGPLTTLSTLIFSDYKSGYYLLYEPYESLEVRERIDDMARHVYALIGNSGGFVEKIREFSAYPTPEIASQLRDILNVRNIDGTLSNISPGHGIDIAMDHRYTQSVDLFNLENTLAVFLDDELVNIPEAVTTQGRTLLCTFFAVSRLMKAALTKCIESLENQYDQHFYNSNNWPYYNSRAEYGIHNKYVDVLEKLTFKYLLFTIMMIILPTSPAGLDRDQSQEEKSSPEAQIFCPKKLLDILTKSSYLRVSGWEIIFHQFFSQSRMPELTMNYKTVDFHNPTNPENTIEFPALGIVFYENVSHSILIDHYNADGEYFYASDTDNWISVIFPDNRIPISYLCHPKVERNQGLLSYGYTISFSKDESHSTVESLLEMIESTDLILSNPNHNEESASLSFYGDEYSNESLVSSGAEETTPMRALNSQFDYSKRRHSI